MGSLLDHIGGHFGCRFWVTLGSLWDHFEVTLRSPLGQFGGHFGGHFGVAFGLLWGSLWGHFWNTLGVILGSFLGFIGVTLGSLWVTLGSRLDHFGGHCWVTLGSLLGHFWGQFCGHFGVAFVVTLWSLLGPPKGLPVSSKNKLDHSARLIPESYPIHARLIQALTWIEGDGWGVVGVWL